MSGEFGTIARGKIELNKRGAGRLAAITDAKKCWKDYERVLHLGLYRRGSPDFGAVCAQATLPKGKPPLNQVIHKEAM